MKEDRDKEWDRRTWHGRMDGDGNGHSRKWKWIWIWLWNGDGFGMEGWSECKNMC